MIPLHDNQPTKSAPVVMILFIILNVAVFVGWQLQVGLERSVMTAALVPSEFTGTFSVDASFPLLASMFMHGGWLHLIGNMWFLWIFGNNIEDGTGHFRFIIFYLLCGIAAALAHVLYAPNSEVPMVGASGAVSGVLGGYLILHPKARVMTLVPLGFFTRIIYIPAFGFLFIWIGFQILLQMVTSVQAEKGGGGVAYLAHIGGFVAGIALIFLFRKR